MLLAGGVMQEGVARSPTGLFVGGELYWTMACFVLVCYMYMDLYKCRF